MVAYPDKLVMLANPYTVTARSGIIAVIRLCKLLVKPLPLRIAIYVDRAIERGYVEFLHIQEPLPNNRILSTIKLF